jgi:hypothetical protein
LSDTASTVTPLKWEEIMKCAVQLMWDGAATTEKLVKVGQKYQETQRLRDE